MTRHKKFEGFTLVELMLSMAFISLLLLAIAMLIIQVSNIYNKGLTMRAVNQVGLTISSDIQRRLAQASPSMVRSAPDNPDDDPSGGRLCVGSTVYAWNYGAFVSDANAFNKSESGAATPIRFVRFDSQGKKYCELVDDAYLPVPSDNVAKLIGDEQANLAIHKFSYKVNQVGSDDTQSVYEVNMRIGTNQTAAIADNGCTVPDSGIDDSYCAVNDFVFTVRVGNKEVAR